MAGTSKDGMGGCGTRGGAAQFMKTGFPRRGQQRAGIFRRHGRLERHIGEVRGNGQPPRADSGGSAGGGTGRQPDEAGEPGGAQARFEAGQPCRPIREGNRAWLRSMRGGPQEALQALYDRCHEIWERWDGYVKGRGFQDAGMNSFAHWAFGAVGEWMMRVVAGIDRDPAVPGWRRAILAPKPGGGLEWAKGAYHSPVGRYEVSWVVEGDVLTLDVVVPPNAEAILEVPTDKVDTIREGDRHPTDSPGVTPLGRNRFRLAAGTYRFGCSR